MGSVVSLTSMAKAAGALLVLRGGLGARATLLRSPCRATGLLELA